VVREKETPTKTIIILSSLSRTVIVIFNTVTKYRYCSMLLNDEDKALIKNLHQSKYCGSRRILSKFSKKNWKREGLDTLLQKLALRFTYTVPSVITGRPTL